MTIIPSVTAPDGVTLAVRRYTEIDPSRPTILAIHGWPDNHHLWDAVAEEFLRQFSGRFNVVAYDVRGSGESTCPITESAYKFPHLVDDVRAVIDSLGIDRVHLLAHDWGSIQAWAAVTDASVMPKVASFTSVSGPHLCYARAFLRSVRSVRSLAQVARQLIASAYIGFFLLPLVPELAFRSRIGVGVVAAAERIGGSGTRAQRPKPHRSIADYINGLKLYRANMPPALLSRGRDLPETNVPVRVLVPRWDLFVTPALQRFTGAIPAGGNVIEIDGGHWVVTSHPEVIARLTAEWVDRNT